MPVEVWCRFAPKARHSRRVGWRRRWILRRRRRWILRRRRHWIRRRRRHYCCLLCLFFFLLVDDLDDFGWLGFGVVVHVFKEKTGAEKLVRCFRTRLELVESVDAIHAQSKVVGP